MTSALGNVDQPTLSADELAKVDGWWRAANYLSAAQIYLLANPLLSEEAILGGPVFNALIPAYLLPALLAAGLALLERRSRPRWW